MTMMLMFSSPQMNDGTDKNREFLEQLRMQQMYGQRNVGGSDPYSYTDPQDGTIYDWDHDKKAWFPKVSSLTLFSPTSCHSEDKSCRPFVSVWLFCGHSAACVYIVIMVPPIECDCTGLVLVDHRGLHRRLPGQLRLQGGRNPGRQRRSNGRNQASSPQHQRQGGRSPRARPHAWSGRGQGRQAERRQEESRGRWVQRALWLINHVTQHLLRRRTEPQHPNPII